MIREAKFLFGERRSSLASQSGGLRALRVGLNTSNMKKAKRVGIRAGRLVDSVWKD